MAKVRLIHCGVGGFGGGWVGVVQRNADVQCVALVDVNAEALKNAAAKIGLAESQCFSTLEAALQAVPCDAVLTVTPPQIHWQHAQLAFKAGKHLISEKPIADTLAHGIEMVKQAKAAAVQLLISQNYRYAPEPRFIRQLIAEEKYGPLVHADVAFALNADFRGSFRETMDYPTLVDMSIHHFDLMRYIIGANAKSIYIKSFRTPAPQFKHEAGFKAIIGFANGVVLNYAGDWTARRIGTSWNGDWQLQCRDGLLGWTGGGLTMSTCGDWNSNKQMAILDVPGMAVRGQDYSLAEFVKAIGENKPGETSGLDNLNSFGLVDAALKSIERGAPVNLSEVVPQI